MAARSDEELKQSGRVLLRSPLIPVRYVPRTTETVNRHFTHLSHNFENVAVLGTKYILSQILIAQLFLVWLLLNFPSAKAEQKIIVN